MEERRTAELMSDFDDYEISSEGVAALDPDSLDDAPESGEKSTRRKKKTR